MEAFDQRRIDQGELIEVRINLRLEIEPLAVRRSRLLCAHESRHRHRRRGAGKRCSKRSGLRVPVSRERYGLVRPPALDTLCA